MSGAPLPCLTHSRSLAGTMQIALAAAVLFAVALSWTPLFAADPVVRVEYRVQLDEHSPLAYGPM